MQKSKIILISMLSLLATFAQAETLYVIDELKIGLHESPSISSPILKLVPSGTELNVLESKDDLVKVKDPEGVNGWVNSKYLVSNKPGKAQVNELEKEIELLKSKTTMTSDTSEEEKDLAQQLNSERLKSGELQAQLTDLKTRIASVDNSEQFLADIEQLKQENEQLQSQLESSGIQVQTKSNSGNNTLSLHGWREYLIAFCVVLLIGMVIGAFFLDYFNRRRHGGFRI